MDLKEWIPGFGSGKKEEKGGNSHESYSTWLGTIGTRHLSFWLSVFKYARYQLGWSDLGYMFSL